MISVPKTANKMYSIVDSAPVGFGCAAPAAVVSAFPSGFDLLKRVGRNTGRGAIVGLADEALCIAGAMHSGKPLEAGRRRMKETHLLLPLMLLFATAAVADWQSIAPGVDYQEFRDESIDI